ncbi:hypothetical protein Tco_0140784 [Tanacetum coccineum]
MYIDGQMRGIIVDRNAKFADFENQIQTLKLQLSATVESHKTLSTTVDVLKKESKAKEDKYLEEIIDLEKKKKALDNVVYKIGLSMRNDASAQRKVHSLYCGHTIVKPHDVLAVTDTEETLILAEESRLKMHAKQNDPILKEKKFNIAPIDDNALNKLSKNFVKHFVAQKELSAEQAFWLPILQPVSESPLVQSEPILKEIPR